MRYECEKLIVNNRKFGKSNLPRRELSSYIADS